MKEFKIVLTSNEDYTIHIPKLNWTLDEFLSNITANPFIKIETITGNLIINTNHIVFAEILDSVE